MKDHEATRRANDLFSELKVYGMAFNAALQAKLEYKVDFVVSLLTSVMLQLAALGFWWVVFHQTPTLRGWDGTQVLFLMGMTAMALGGSELFFNHIWFLPFYVVMGDLDRLVTYPVHSLPFLLTSRPELHSFGNILTGAALAFGALWMRHEPLSMYLLVPLWAVCGTLVYTGALVIFGSLSFRFVGPYGFTLMIPHTLLQANRYPLDIYPRWMHLLLLLVIPFGTCAFLPGHFVFGKGFGIWGALAAPVGAAVTLYFAHRMWLWGLRQYQSTGS